MNEHYKGYSKAIRDEIEEIKNNEIDQIKPNNKSLNLWKKIRLNITLLLKKAL